MEQAAIGRLYRGWAIVERVDVEAGIAEMEATASVLPVGRYITTIQVPYAYLRAGFVERGIVTIDEKLALPDQARMSETESGLYRLKGDAITMRDPSAISEAETYYRKAIEIAKSQSAKWWELCATVSLARLLHRTNRRDEARTMLAEIYNWFTDGFDTLDLIEAKALLDELSQ